MTKIDRNTVPVEVSVILDLVFVSPAVEFFGRYRSSELVCRRWCGRIENPVHTETPSGIVRQIAERSSPLTSQFLRVSSYWSVRYPLLGRSRPL